MLLIFHSIVNVTDTNGAAIQMPNNAMKIRKNINDNKGMFYLNFF